jgi:hypothetical protein
MSRAALLAAILGIATTALLPRSLAAQTEFAVPLGRGQLRVDFSPLWLTWDHRFDPGAPQPVPISTDFNSDVLGVETLPFLQPLQDQIQSITGLTKFSLNLGHAPVTLTSSVRTIPIAVELGLTGRLAIGVTVPIVRSRVDASFELDTAKARQSNVGLNPGLLGDTAAASFRRQMDSALAALQTQAASGPAALRAQAQAALAALQPYLAVSAAPFLPRGGTEAADSITSRLRAAEAGYGQLAAQYQAQGVTLPPLTAGMSLPDTAALSRDGLERFFSDSVFPLAADTFGTVVRTGIGDITAHATYQFAEGARYRGQLLVTARFPTGQAPSASNFLDLGTGTHRLGFEVALANDLLLGRGLLIHGVGRVGGSGSDQEPMRVTPPQFPIVPLSQQALIKIEPASYFAIDLAPTWVMDDAFSVRVAYSYFSQGATRHSYVDPADSARVGLPAGVLDLETAMQWMRIGAGVTFSTLDRYARGRASLPYSVTVGYENTIWGGAGRVPQVSAFHITLRAYVRLFGRDARVPAQ